MAQYWIEELQSDAPLALALALALELSERLREPAYRFAAQ
jgi:hypothetical protein